MLLISEGPKPVAVRLCLSLVNSGPTGPLSSEMGALVEGLLSRVVVEVAIVSYKAHLQALIQATLKESLNAANRNGKKSRKC